MSFSRPTAAIKAARGAVLPQTHLAQDITERKMLFRSSLVLGVLLISLLLISKDVAAARDQFTETTDESGDVKNVKPANGIVINDEKWGHGYYGGAGYGGSYGGGYGGGYGGYMPGHGWYGGGYGHHPGQGHGYDGRYGNEHGYGGGGGGYGAGRGYGGGGYGGYGGGGYGGGGYMGAGHR